MVLLASSAVLSAVGQMAAVATVPLVALLGLGGGVAAAACIGLAVARDAASLRTLVDRVIVPGATEVAGDRGDAEARALVADLAGERQWSDGGVEGSVALDLDRDGGVSVEDFERWRGRGW